MMGQKEEFSKCNLLRNHEQSIVCYFCNGVYQVENFNLTIYMGKFQSNLIYGVKSFEKMTKSELLLNICSNNATLKSNLIFIII